MFMSPVSKVIFERRSSANFSRISASSSLMTVRRTPSSARIASSSAIVSRSLAISVSRSTRARRVSRPSGMSRMCSACTSENSKGSAMSAVRAAARSSEPRMRAMTSSMTSTALSRPSTMWARSWAFFEAELGPAADDLDLVLDVGLQRLHEVERAGDAVDEGHRVDREVRLQRRVLVEVVEDDERRRVLLQLDDEAGLALGRLVVDVGDALDLAGLHQLGDAAAVTEIDVWYGISVTTIWSPLRPCPPRSRPRPACGSSPCRCGRRR